MELNRAGTDFSASRGLTHNFFWLQMESLWKLFELGEWDQLLARATAVIDWDRAQGESRISHASRCAVAAVLVRRGRAAEAKELADVFLPAARRTGETQTLAPALVCAATIEAARGELSGAIELLEELGEQTRDRSPIYRALWLPDAIRSCAAARQLELAHRLLTGFDVVAPRHVYGVLTARATLAEAEGDLAGALAAYSDASTRWRQFGHVLEAGYALLGKGRCLRQAGRITEADAPLKEARGIFTRLGAEPFAAEVTGLLAAAPPVTRHPDVSP
jgi:tetratricopeptide (TPR) repeat protein